MEDFVVETKGKCFICLDNIPPVDAPISIKLEPDYLESEAVAGSTYHSIRHLSRYLGINNLREVYRNEKEIIASNLGVIKERSRLKVELCQDCANLNEVLSKQCQQLEKIELEMVPILEQVQRKLLIEDDAGRSAQEFRDDGHIDETTTSLGGVKGKYQNAEELRFEALEKCSQRLKLASPSPRVKLQKLTLNQLDEEKRKIGAKPIGQGCWRTTGNDQYSIPSPLTILVETIKSESCQRENEEEENEYPDVAVEVSEPSPLFPILSAPDMGSNLEFELHHPEDSELSTPIVMAHVKVEHESHAPEIQNSSEASNTTLVGQEVKPDKILKHAAGNKLVTIPPPIKTAGVATAKLRRCVDPETGKHTCSSCTKQFTRYASAWTHHQRVHLKVRYNCTVCSKEFVLARGYRDHYQNAHMHVRFKCQRCNKAFTQKHTLIQHQRSAHLGLRSKCKFCPVTFGQAGDRNRHMKRNHSILDNEKKGNESSNDVMEATSKPSPLSPGLNVPEIGSEQHIAIRHPEDSELSTPIVVAHMNVEHESHPESGNSSEASHKTLKIRKSRQDRNPKTSMKLAIGVYSVTIPVPIEVGGVAAGEFRSRVEPKTGKISCGSCAKQFAHHSGVWRHHNSEHLKVRYKCSLCGKEFTQPQYYRDHFQSVHIHVRFECQHCNKIFTQKKSLSVHQRSVHLGVSFKCEFCPKTFSLVKDKIRHMKARHTS